jgi:hypothetical protein
MGGRPGCQVRPASVDKRSTSTAMLTINWHPTLRHLRQFAGTLIAVALIAGLWLYHVGRGRPVAYGGLTLAAVLGLLGVVWPLSIRWLYVAWMAAAFPIGWLVSHLLVAVIFYLILTPVGLLCRLFGYDPMRRSRDQETPSYWIPRPSSDDTQRYFKQY